MATATTHTTQRHDMDTPGVVTSCDFYVNPTILSRLILHQKYAVAVRRLHRYPHEAHVWVCRVRPPDVEQHTSSNDSLVSQTLAPDYQGCTGVAAPSGVSDCGGDHSYRQLPIHMACQNLGLYDDPKQATTKLTRHWRAALEHLVCRLILTYPAGCRHADHARRYPLHECIRYSASLEIITLLLTAAPTVLNCTDHTGLDAQAVHAQTLRAAPHTAYGERVTKVLAKGRVFWEAVRHKAMAQRRAKKEATAACATPHTVPLTDTASVADTIWSDRCEAPSSHSGLQARPVQAMGWNQLEQRCIILEQLLAEQMRHAYKSKGIAATTTPESALELCQLQDKVQVLSRQNQHYQERIEELESNVRDLLWVSGAAASSGEHSTQAGSSQDFVVESHAVSSLSYSDVAPPPNKANQPRGMFGETSIASTILPATSFESRHVVDLELRSLSPMRDSLGGWDHAPLCSGPVRGSHGCLDRSHFLVRDDSDSDLDTILAEAELQNGTKLSAHVIRAWKAINVETVDDNDDDDDIDSVQAVMEPDDFSTSLRGVEFAGSHQDEPMASPTSRERANRSMYHMVVTPIND